MQNFLIRIRIPIIFRIPKVLFAKKKSLFSVSPFFFSPESLWVGSAHYATRPAPPASISGARIFLDPLRGSGGAQEHGRPVALVGGQCRDGVVQWASGRCGHDRRPCGAITRGGRDRLPCEVVAGGGWGRRRRVFPCVELVALRVRRRSVRAAERWCGHVAWRRCGTTGMHGRRQLRTTARRGARAGRRSMQARPGSRPA